MEEIKKLTIPEGYEFDKDGEVILKKKDFELPKTWGECSKGLCMSYYPAISWYVPNENDGALRALCKLLICRNAWWKLLGWKPDWENTCDKFCIVTAKSRVTATSYCAANAILAFPTEEVRDHFYETFEDLIEEAKELL